MFIIKRYTHHGNLLIFKNQEVDILKAQWI